MFYQCKALVTPPELPATTVKADCYNRMFSTCIGLTSVPVLSATKMADSCYS